MVIGQSRVVEGQNSDIVPNIVHQDTAADATEDRGRTVRGISGIDSQN